MSTPQTPAQAAQQNNRDAAGRYQTKTHSEADVELNVSGGFGSSHTAAEAAVEALPARMQEDYLVEEDGNGADIVSEWDPESDPGFSVVPADSASYRITAQASSMPERKVSIQRAGEQEQTVWDPEHESAAVFTDGQGAAAFMQQSLAASIADRMVEEEDLDYADRLASALDAPVARAATSYEPEHSEIDWGRQSDDEEIVYAVTDEQAIVDEDGQEQTYRMHTVAYAGPTEDYDPEDPTRNIHLHTYVSDDQNGVQEVNGGAQMTTFSEFDSDGDIRRAAEYERSRLAAGGLLPNVQDHQKVYAVRRGRDGSVQMSQGGFED